MAEDMVHLFDRTIGESTRVIAPNRGSAIRPPTTAPNFNVKGNHLSQVEENQFDGVVKWDPYDHVEKFEKVCRLFKYGETQMPHVKLELFPLSLTGEAANWYKNLDENIFEKWEELREGFIERFFPSQLVETMKLEIQAFKQLSGEDLVDAWKRLKELMRICPGHGIRLNDHILIFFRGLDSRTQRQLDWACRGNINNVTYNEAYKIMEDMVRTSVIREAGRTKPDLVKTGRRSVARVDNGGSNDVVGEIKALASHMDKQFASMDGRFGLIEKDLKTAVAGCDICGDKHYTEDCDKTPRNEEVDYVQNQYQPPFANRGLFLRNGAYQNRYQGNSNSNFNSNGAGNYRSTLGASWQGRNQGGPSVQLVEVLDPNAELRDLVKKFMVDQDKKNENYQTDIIALNDKMNQNIKSQQAAIKDLGVRLDRMGNSNRQQGSLPSNTQKNPNLSGSNDGSNKYQHPNVDSEDEEDEQVDEEIVVESDQAVKPPVVPLTSTTPVAKPTVVEPQVKPYKPKIPFPQRLKMDKLKEQYGMSNYAKFIMDLVTDKRKLEEAKSTFLNAESDIGASINLMPFSVYRRLSLAALKPTRMSIRLADHSFQYPMGIAENLCVKVGHIVFLADFVILEMEEDAKVPLILGRPFLYTADAIIRVKDKIISLEDEALEMELMNFLDTDEGEALLACSEEEQVMVADMV
uniref:uncharacterized protein LOC122578972 n=1 Tax=Erigeron canadensis TaxID=72917 RepID=UPI001CB98F68|nr:uncharacterized protein LOC122578972 [Erigeron canadensis]